MKRRFKLAAIGLALLLAAPLVWRFLPTPVRNATWRLTSAALVDGASLVSRVYDPYADTQTGPSCNCSGGIPYRCDRSDLEFYERVRSDARLRPVLKPGQHDLETYLSYREFLRDYFPHGRHSVQFTKPWVVGRFDLLEMLDEAERGEKFLCGEISRMLAQMIRASGGFARLVRLSADASAGNAGHVVVEAWLPQERIWVVLDADYNVYFTGTAGEPLDALDLHRIQTSGRPERAVAHPGASQNTLYQPDGHSRMLALYQVIAFDESADWIQSELPYWHPRRHPRTNTWVWGRMSSFGSWQRGAHATEDPEFVYFEPCLVD